MEEQQVTGESAAEQHIEAENQERRGFTQEELDRIVKERLSRERSKILKQYEGVDVDLYRQMLDQQQQKEQEEQVKRGEFEKILQSTVGKKDTEIQRLQNELRAIKVDGSLLNAASQGKAINPQQVARLLKDQIRLGSGGEVEVLDDQGTVRYNDQGSAMSVDELVREFLQTNPHFVNAGPSGTGSQSKVANANGNMGVPDVSKLNMNNPSDRKLFKEMMGNKGIRI